VSIIIQSVPNKGTSIPAEEGRRDGKDVKNCQFNLSHPSIIILYKNMAKINTPETVQINPYQ
jgi:hypothetical protein